VREAKEREGLLEDAHDGPSAERKSWRQPGLVEEGYKQEDRADFRFSASSNTVDRGP
jgi:hypothetical protein